MSACPRCGGDVPQSPVPTAPVRRYCSIACYLDHRSPFSERVPRRKVVAARPAATEAEMVALLLED